VFADFTSNRYRLLFLTMAVENGTVGAASDPVVETCRFLDKMLELIPPRYYFHSDEADELLNRKKQYAKNLDNKAPDQARKEASKRARKEKFNSESPATVPSLIAAKASKADESPSDDEEDDNSSSAEAGSAAAVAAAAPPQSGGSRKRQYPPPEPITGKPTLPIEDLKARLQQKIQELRTQRKYDPDLGSTSKRNARMPLEARQLKSSRSDKKAQKHQTAASANDGDASLSGSASDAPKHKKPKHEPATTAAPPAPTAKGSGTSPKKLKQDLQFGTFTFTDGKPIPTYLAQKPKKKPLKQLIKDVEERNKQMQELSNTAEGQKLKDDEKWDAALKKASGEKVKDDLHRLKRSLKRKEREKKKSATEWKGRMEQVARSQREAQEKRKANISEKVKKRKDKKMGIKPKKSPKGRAGFEGKKKGFLNR
jgi:hypothetical protein